MVSTRGTMEPSSTTPARCCDPVSTEPFRQASTTRTGSGFQVLELPSWGGSVEQVFTEIYCVAVLVADETLKKGMLMSTGSGYNTGQIYRCRDHSSTSPYKTT